MQTNNSKEKVRQLQNKLYLTAKKCDSRRFHAFECLPETVTARIKRAEEDMNGT